MAMTGESDRAIVPRPQPWSAASVSKLRNDLADAQQLREDSEAKQARHTQQLREKEAAKRTKAEKKKNKAIEQYKLTETYELFLKQYDEPNYEIEVMKECLQHRKTTFISINLESTFVLGCPYGTSKVTEIGITRWHMKLDLDNKPVTSTKVYIIPQNMETNLWKTFDSFNHGFKNIHVRGLSTVAKKINRLCSELKEKSVKEDTTFVLVVHNAMDQMKMRQMGVDFDGIPWIDTQTLFSKVGGGEDKGLKDCLDFYQIPGGNFHNAGNNSYYIVELLSAIGKGMRSDGLVPEIRDSFAYLFRTE